MLGAFSPQHSFTCENFCVRSRFHAENKTNGAEDGSLDLDTGKGSRRSKAANKDPDDDDPASRRKRRGDAESGPVTAMEVTETAIQEDGEKDIDFDMVRTCFCHSLRVTPIVD